MAPVLPVLVPKPVGVGTSNGEGGNDSAFNQLASKVLSISIVLAVDVLSTLPLPRIGRSARNSLR